MNRTGHPWRMVRCTKIPLRALALSTALCLQAFATPTGDTYRLTRSAIANGGGTATGGSFAVQVTIGQVAAGPAYTEAMSGGSYRLQGGFWIEASPDPLFGNGFE